MACVQNIRATFIRILLLAIAVVPCNCSILHASGHAAAEPAAEESSPSEDVKYTLKINLGNIELRNLEPTRGRTAHMSFDLHLTLDPNTDPEMLKELPKWQHRLREQVIVAVRTTEIYDFLDPSLKRFRRQILYRVNRMLKGPIVTDALFTNFVFSSE